MGAKCSTLCDYCCDYCCTTRGCTLVCSGCAFGCQKLCCCCCDHHRYSDPSDVSKHQRLSTTLKDEEKQLLINANTKSERYTSHIILMGDSVLDNFYWIEDNRLDIRQQIENDCKQNNQDIMVLNYAVDESETKDVVKGMVPDDGYVHERQSLGMKPYPIDTSDDQGKVYPLKLMSQLIESINNSINININNDDEQLERSIDVNSKLNPTVVLSIGGNDFRMVLGTGGEEVLKYGSQSMIDGMINYDFVKNYEIILATMFPKNKYSIETIEKHKLDNKNNNYKFEISNRINSRFSWIQLILVYPYQPGTTWYVYEAVPGNPTFNQFAIRQFFNVMEWGFGKICDLAYKYRLPIIDLSRTFDPNNEKHFGSSPIEPSNLSGQFIADLVKYVLKIYNFEDINQESLIFYGIKQDNEWNGIIVEKNTKQARKRYLSDIIARNGPVLSGKAEGTQPRLTLS